MAVVTGVETLTGETWLGDPIYTQTWAATINTGVITANMTGVPLNVFVKALRFVGYRTIPLTIDWRTVQRAGIVEEVGGVLQASTTSNIIPENGWITVEYVKQ